MTPIQQINILNQAETKVELKRLYNAICCQIDQFKSKEIFILLATYDKNYTQLSNS